MRRTGINRKESHCSDFHVGPFDCKDWQYAKTTCKQYCAVVGMPIFRRSIVISQYQYQQDPLRLPIIVVAFDGVTWGLSLVVDPQEVRKCHRFCPLYRPVVVVAVRRRFAGHSNLNDLSEPHASIEAGPVGSLCCYCNRERGSDGNHIVEQAQPILSHT